jgi:hypothetical protein
VLYEGWLLEKTKHKQSNLRTRRRRRRKKGFLLSAHKQTKHSQLAYVVYLGLVVEEKK